MGIGLSVVIGLWFSRTQRGLGLLVAVVALTLTFRCVFESVIAPYYVSRRYAFALVSGSVASWLRSAGATLIAASVNWTSNFHEAQQLGLVADRGWAGRVGRSVVARTHGVSSGAILARRSRTLDGATRGISRRRRPSEHANIRQSVCDLQLVSSVSLTFVN